MLKAAVRVLLPTLLLLWAACAVAQPARLKPAADADLRALYANAADIAEGKRLAESSCARCHGANGISSTRGIPNIAGQRAAYLHLQLRAYRQGARAKGPMGGAVGFLSDEALIKVAAYFGSLEPAKPAAAKPVAQKSDPLQAGKAAAAACGACHGDNGTSKTPGTPSLVGFNPTYFVAAMSAYKSGQRKNDMMKSMAGSLNDADLANVALYYALQKPARAQTPAAGDAAAGKAAAGACSGCHGETGVSASPETPSLAGQDAQYLSAALLAYKDKARKDEAMQGIAAALDEQTTRNIAAYYAAQQPQAPGVRKPLSVAEWVERCDRCHGSNGNSTDALIPALAGQRADWLETVLQAYRSGARKSAAMSAMSSGLSETDIKELSAYYARQTPRAVLYVVVPEGQR
ncbi:MAG TPA: c-type cytochrome [Burkholderiales bacterium]|nr:c-type cytochrome [Burkholderiales bacterium]